MITVTTAIVYWTVEIQELSSRRRFCSENPCVVQKGIESELVVMLGQ